MVSTRARLTPMASLFPSNLFLSAIFHSLFLSEHDCHLQEQISPLASASAESVKIPHSPYAFHRNTLISFRSLNNIASSHYQQYSGGGPFFLHGLKGSDSHPYTDDVTRLNKCLSLFSATWDTRRYCG